MNLNKNIPNASIVYVQQSGMEKVKLYDYNNNIMMNKKFNN